jgi:hypothetical protein
MESFKPIANANALIYTTIRSEFLLESLYFLSKDKPTGIKHLIQRRMELITVAKIDSLEIKKRDYHSPSFTAARNES